MHAVNTSRDVLLMGALHTMGSVDEDDPIVEVPGTTIVVPGPVPGWPAPAVVRQRAWFEGDDGVWRYLVQSGDTVSGLARSYLGAFERWREIWGMQSGAVRARGADHLLVGDVLAMPDEAIANAVRYGAIVVPGVDVPPGPPPGTDDQVIVVDVPPEDRPDLPAVDDRAGGVVTGGRVAPAGWSTGQKVAVGVGVVAGLGAVGAGIYYATR